MDAPEQHKLQCANCRWLNDRPAKYCIQCAAVLPVLSVGPGEDFMQDEDLSDAGSRSFRDSIPSSEIEGETDTTQCPSCGFVNEGVPRDCGNCRRPFLEPLSANQVDEEEAKQGFSPLAKHMRVFWSIIVASILLDIALFTVWIFAFAGLPWFIYVFAVTGALCGTLYLFSKSDPDQFLKLHILLSVIVNFTVFFTYFFVFSSQPYFAYVLIPSGALFLLHLFLIDYWGDIPRPHKFFYIDIFCIFIPLNALLFVAFISSSPSSAWFAFPLWATSVIPLVHYILAFHQSSPHKWFYVHLALELNLAGLLFMVWWVSGTIIPWFVYIWSFQGIVLAAHYAYDYHPVAIKRLASKGVGHAGGIKQMVSSFNLPAFGRKKDSAPDVVTPEASANWEQAAEDRQATSPPSQV